MKDYPDIPTQSSFPLLNRLGMLFFTFLIGMFLAQGILQVILQQEGKDLQELLLEVKSGNPTEAIWILLMQAGNQIFGFGLAAILCGVFSQEVFQVIPRQKIKPLSLFLIMILILLSIPLIPLISWDADSFRLPEYFQAIEKMLEEAEAESEMMLQTLIQEESGIPKVVQFLVFAGLPAICEELFFRGAMQYYFSKRWGPIQAIWITGLIFSLIHFQIYGFFARFFLGVLFGYLVYWSGNLLTAVWGHFVFNASSLILMGFTSSDTADSGEFFPWFIVLPAIAGFVFIFILLRRIFLSPKPYESEN
jgi:membrane protease YdiL (CAAX protease family)